jgi:Fe-S oxidoreductase
VNVDMATYKSEFTHHHYARRPWARPLSHWSMGWLPLWSRLASRAPKLVNTVAKRKLIKRLGGIAQERDIPEFAEQTFEAWFATHAKPQATNGKVMLWPDTLTNFLSPEIGQAAVEVLEAAGFEVVLPDKPVCCGLTWISTGQLGIAKRVIERSLNALAPALAAGTPIVGLEPSCTAALRQDASDLLEGNPLAKAAAASTQTLAEFLTQQGWEPPQVGGEALVQPHCHQHAVLGFDADKALMAKAGIKAVVPDAGCCGLAGNFGFEPDHYDLSQAVGERVLLPAVRNAAADTAILADGFSCRTQITHGTTRHPQHLAQLLAAALTRKVEDKT